MAESSTTDVAETNREGMRAAIALDRETLRWAAGLSAVAVFGAIWLIAMGMPWGGTLLLMPGTLLANEFRKRKS